MSNAQDFVNSFMDKLAGTATLIPALKNIFSTILAKQVTVVGSEVTLDPAFEQLAKIFTFISTPAADRPATPVSYDATLIADAKTAAAAENSLELGVDPELPTDEPTEEPGVEDETFSLTAALEAQEAGELPAAYRIEDTLTAPAIETTLAQAQANIDAAKAGYAYSEEEQAILDGAASTKISITVAYSLTNAAGNLGTLTVAQAQLVAGAENAGDYQFTVPVNADDVVGISAQGPVTEGNDIDFTVTMAEAVNFDRTVEFVIEGVETATATKADPLADLGIREGVITIPAGETTGVLTLTPIDDNITEGREAFVVKLLNSDGTEDIATSNIVVIRDPENAGQTYVLTTGVDEFVGGAGDDIFRAVVDGTAANQTWTALDNLNGGAGNDTLFINDISDATKEGIDLSMGTIANIETMNIQAVADIGSGAVTGIKEALDVSEVAGLTTINTTKSVNAALIAADTTDVNVSGATGNVFVNGGKDVSVSKAAAGDISIGDGTTDPAGTITVTSTKQTGDIAIDGGTDVTVTATSVADSGDITIGGNAGIATGDIAVTANLNNDGVAALAGGNIAVTGGETVTVTVNSTITAKNATAKGDITNGTINVTGDDNTTTVTVAQNQTVTPFITEAVAAVKATQEVTFKALASGQTVTVNGLVFKATKALTANEVAQAFSNLTVDDTQTAGGKTANGFFTGDFGATGSAVTGWTSGAANGAKVVFTAPADNTTTKIVVASSATPTSTPDITAAIVAGTAAVPYATTGNTVTNGVVTIADSGDDSITTVSIDGYDDGSTVDAKLLTSLVLKNNEKDADLEVKTTSTGSLNLTVDNITSSNIGTADAEVSLDGTAATVTGLTLTTENNASEFSLKAAAVTNLTINAGANLNIAGNSSDIDASENITIAGAGAVILGDISGANLVSFNASTNTGGVTATIDTAAATMTALNDAGYVFSAGNDTVTLDNATTTVKVNGGAGTDTLAMDEATLKALVAANVANNITNFERLSITDAVDTTSDVDVDLEALGGYNYVITNGTKTAATGDLNLQNMANNGTVVLSGVQTSGGTITVAVKDADAVDADSTDFALNVITKGDLDLGTVTVDNVATINITTTETYTGTTANKDMQTLVVDGDAVETIVITGAGAINLTNEGHDATTADFIGALSGSAASGSAASSVISTVVTMIDGSGMTGSLFAATSVADQTIKGGSAADFIIADDARAIINGGDGDDTIFVTSSASAAVIDGGAGADTFNVTDAALGLEAFATFNNVGTGDKFVLNAASFSASQVNMVLEDPTTTDWLNAAFAQTGNSAANEAIWFQHNGNTYIVDNVVTGADAGYDAKDVVVKITGLVDLSTASFNADDSTLEIA